MSILPTEANLWLVVRKKHIATGWGPYTMDSGTTVSSFRIWKWWNRNSIPWPRRTICVLILALLLCDLRSISLMPFWASGVFFKKTSPLRMYACWVTQLCPTLCNSMDCSPPGSSLHGILQTRILGGVAIPFSRGSSPGIEPRSPVLQADSFTVWATREAPFYWRPTMWQDLCWTLTPWWKIQPCPPKLVLSEEEKIGKWC